MLSPHLRKFPSVRNCGWPAEHNHSNDRRHSGLHFFLLSGTLIPAMVACGWRIRWRVGGVRVLLAVCMCPLVSWRAACASAVVRATRLPPGVVRALVAISFTTGPCVFGVVPEIPAMKSDFEDGALHFVVRGHECVHSLHWLF